MGILKDWWWDIALTLLTKVHPCCLKSQNFLMVFLKPPCLARWFSLRIGSWDFPILNQSITKLPTNEVMIKANLTSVISPPDYRWRLSSVQFTSSSIFGSQKDIEEQADAIIMYFGLNRTHCTALLWSPLRTHTFCPFSAFQIWIRPSVEPLITNCESGEKEASRGKFFEFRWPVKDWRVAPL